MTDAPLPDARLDAVVSRLDRPKRDKDGYRARCPAHDGDNQTALRVSPGRDCILLYCFAGCSADQVRVALGLEWRQLFYDDRKPFVAVKRPFDRRGMDLEQQMMQLRLAGEPEVLRRCKQERGWILPALQALEVGWDGERLTLPTRDKDGKLNDVLRYLPWGDVKRKMLATADRPRLPWPRPEAVRTESRCLYVVEGEGTAIALASCWMPVVALPGAVARTSGDLRRPGKFEGVGWHKAWAARFREHARIVLLPDCDEVGRLLMRTVAYDLGEQTDAVVTTCDLGLEDGEDYGDLVKLCSTPEQRKHTRSFTEALWGAVARRPDQAEPTRELIRDWAGWLRNPGLA